ncbi:hypothetical protein [Cupriavidus pauculus]|uniref:hypothetical protein n=2 Tax=Cupriavidus pauculus TaxID=82633 RepID=UPI0012CD331B|nr:hypothetical protein [Cupriavidus pauculus]KAB0602201.1 hypothetical protein F7R19_14015 [Cupriavidus pauculus]UAL02484.1 hypothetical protein K8O84_27440 [Cupriavidus pauculus]
MPRFSREVIGESGMLDGVADGVGPLAGCGWLALFCTMSIRGRTGTEGLRRDRCGVIRCNVNHRQIETIRQNADARWQPFAHNGGLSWRISWQSRASAIDLNAIGAEHRGKCPPHGG